LVVPQSNIDTLWFEKELKPWIKLITVGEHCDYFDAIYLSKLICEMDGFVAEGGAKNVARRDGMATTVLSAATTIGEIPDYYFQAVGSGTGAIAAWEANLRLNDDGRFGTKKMRLIVSQNAPFLLIYDSWKRRNRELVDLDAETAKQQLERINAKVLSNRHPPYSLKGGLYDALVDTEGDVVSVTNNEAELAANLFLETEGIDIAPAASVALASLRSYARSGGLDTDSTIMLNITGGGIERFQKEHRLFHLRPSLTVEPDELQSHPVREKIYSLYKGEMIGSIR
jgi:cysteate synthase